MINLQSLQIANYSPITLKLEAGECMGISGASGSGKTRLLRAIADMDERGGEVIVDGVVSQSIAASEWRKKVALLPAESVWWFDTIGEHFRFYNHYFSALGFSEEVMSWDVTRCSSGEKQRLSIVRLLESCPTLLLLDEPTANLDLENARRVESLIASYLADNQASAIWVGHSAEQLKRVSNMRFTMKEGVLNQITDARQVTDE